MMKKMLRDKNKFMKNICNRQKCEEEQKTFGKVGLKLTLTQQVVSKI